MSTSTAGRPEVAAPTPAGAVAPAVFGPLYRVLVRGLLGRAKIAGLGALGAVAVLVGILIAAAGGDDAVRSWVRFADTFGLSLLAPVVALLFASAALGNLVEDGTMVYVWLRPVRRREIVGAAYAASLTPIAPLVLVPLTIGAAIATGDLPAVVGTLTAAAVATAGYTGIFLWLGLLLKRSLVWGLAYILLWEGFVAGASRGASRLALRAYSRSILDEATGVRLRLANVSLTVGVLVPLLVAAVAVALTSRRLARTDVP
jgi:ABC-2 type transport system permease protein